MNCDNRTRLEALLTLFDISISDAGKIAGVSRSLVSKVSSGDPRVNGDMIFSRLENRLGELIGKRRKAFFNLESIPADTIQAVMASIETKKKAA